MKFIRFECDTCEENIENPEEMVKVEIDDIPQKTTTQRHFHSDCWEGVE
jgi:hypothetical protein